jgi:hypothetical protein
MIVMVKIVASGLSGVDVASSLGSFCGSTLMMFCPK